MKNKIYITLFFLFLLFNFSLQTEEEEESTEPEEDPTLTYKCSTNSTEKIEIGDKVYICIHIKELQKRMVFQVEVDKYSTLTIAGAYQLAHQGVEQSSKFDNQTMNFIAQINDKVTKIPTVYYKKKLEDDTEEVFPVLNIVIKVDEGKITDIVWDNQCFSCQSKYCEKFTANSLYKPKEEISYSNCKSDSISKDFFGNDPKFYLTWFGTDKQKRQMKSSNLAMSKFKQYSIGSLYNSVKDSYKIDKTKITEDEINDKIKELL